MPASRAGLRKAVYAAGFLAAIGGGFALAAHAAGRTAGPAVEVAQADLGFNCQTGAGTCPAAPQPVGASCQCGSASGFIVP